MKYKKLVFGLFKRVLMGKVRKLLKFLESHLKWSHLIKN